MDDGEFSDNEARMTSCGQHDEKTHTENIEASR